MIIITELYFEYGDTEIAHLKSRDKALGQAIDTIGIVNRRVNPNLFEALVNSIVGQQISTKAQITIWNRMKDALGSVTPETVSSLGASELQKFGISMRKAIYIEESAGAVLSGGLDLASLRYDSDQEVCRKLSALPGIGVWTAEMLMTFSMQRPDIISFGDLAIRRGLRMLYRHRNVDKGLFEKYRRRYSPYASVASLYLWAIAGGAIEGLSDPAAKKIPASKKASVSKTDGAGQ